MDNTDIKIKLFQGYIHYYIEDDYLGLLVFEKGEVSDHRAIIRKNKININNNNLYKVMRTTLFTLLNHYLEEKKFYSKEEIQNEKNKIVLSSDNILKKSAQKIIDNNMIKVQND